MKKHGACIRGRVSLGGLVVVVLLLGLGAGAQPGPPGQTETDRVVEAHREIDTARVDVRYAQYFGYPDETEFAVAEYQVVFDRANKRVRIDRPGYTLVCDGEDVLLVAEALPGRHLRMPMEDSFTYERLVEIFPDLANPPAPALVLLLAESPVGQLSAGQADQFTRITPKHDVPRPAVYLSVPMQEGTAQLVVDKATNRLSSTHMEVDAKLLAGSGLDAVRLHYDVAWSKVGEPIDEGVFELDVKQSHEFTTLAAFLSPNGGNAQPGPGGQGGAAAGNSLVGMPLPEIELDLMGTDEKVKLSELDEGVVILECFATWSKTSVLDLPALAEYRAWCKEKGHDVRVYGVVVGEQEQQMVKWMEALEKTAKKEVDVPILMDTSTDAVMAMRLPTVPRTLIVVDGRVVDVYGGVKPTYLEDLKAGTPGWVEKVDAEGEEEQGEEDE